MAEKYPYESGDGTVIGPECFAGQADNGVTVINWKGENYVPQSEEAKDYRGPIVLRDELAAWLYDYEPVDYDSVEAAAAHLEQFLDGLGVLNSAAVPTRERLARNG